MNKHCGIVAIIGEPNAGKSTLVNRMVGGKVSIVSPKVQTTRVNTRGICMHGHTQIILTDTPGIFSAEKPFEKTLVKAAWNGLKDADALLVLLDTRRGITESTHEFIRQLKKRTHVPCFLALNKIDKIKKDKLIELATTLDKEGIFERIFMISALTGDGVDDVKKQLAEKMPKADWLYPDDQMSDQQMNQIAAEITREKIFFKLAQELPYSIMVEPEQWEETSTGVKISQCILVQKESQKKIVIGQNASMLKQIGMSSRRELEKMLGKKVHLSLFVKVEPDWQRSAG